jgi:hypothetical protein
MTEPVYPPIGIKVLGWTGDNSHLGRYSCSSWREPHWEVVTWNGKHWEFEDDDYDYEWKDRVVERWLPLPDPATATPVPRR